MRRLGGLAVAAFIAWTAGCATMDVSSHVERGLDFTQYRTFDWGPADALPTGDPRLDKDPFFQDHVQGAVEKALAARGFERSAPGVRPDLQIHYHASVTERLDVSGVDRAYGACSGADCPARVTEYEAGTLVIDIVDMRTNRVVWRGWAQDTVRLETVLNDRDTMERRINEAVTRILRQLPPSL
jgi:hypothetical protein